MEKLQKFRKPIFILTKLAIIAVPLWYFIASLGAKQGWWDFGHGMRTMSGEQAKYIGYIAMAFGAATIAMSLLLKPRKPIGVVLGVVALAMPFMAQMQISKLRAAGSVAPGVHDVSTDRLDPPLFTQAILAQREATQGRVNPIGDYAAKTTRNGALVADLVAKGFPDIKTITLAESSDSAFDRALAAANAMGWDIANADKTAGLIEATASTKWYDFKDDVVIRVRGSGNQSLVDVRSISRIGGGDQGKNAGRIRAYMKKLGT